MTGSAEALRADQVRIRGNASAEEIAAVLAMLSRRTEDPADGRPGPYERWRRARIAAVGETLDM
jgi:hypothetical protein